VNPRLTAGRLGQLWPLLFQKRLLLFFLLDQKEPKTCLPKVESRPVALDDPLWSPSAAQNKLAIIPLHLHFEWNLVHK
jgi:hypothetical protein